MPTPSLDPEADPGLNPAHLLLIVVGAHLRAEQGDRPLAYRLREQVEGWVGRHGDTLATPIQPVVCTDIWYLNHSALHARPTVSIGGPGVNALSSHFAQSITGRDDNDQQVVIQIDPEFTDLRVSIWGTDHELTVKGLDLFFKDYLESFLKAVATQVEPET
jgi:hypothetical protein